MSSRSREVDMMDWYIEEMRDPVAIAKIHEIWKGRAAADAAAKPVITKAKAMREGLSSMAEDGHDKDKDTGRK